MSAINALLQGVLLGGYYALIACGLAFMYQVMRIINLAHGSLVVIASFAFWLLAGRWGINPFIALLAIVPAMTLIGWALERGILERSLHHGQLVPLLATFGLAVVIDNLLFLQFGADPRSLANFIGSLSYDSWELADELYVGKLAVLIFVVALVLLGGLSLFLARTPLGRAIRATSEDPDVVGLVGIDAHRINAFAAAIALGTVGVAGLFLPMRGTVTPYSGFGVLLFAFEAVEIGGPGSLWRVLAGGIVLGVAQSFGALVHPQGFLIAGHSVFLVILIARVALSRSVLGQVGARLLRWN